MNIAICFGTRPEYLKLLPVIREFKQNSIECTVYFIQQHTNLAESLDEEIIAVQLPTISPNRLDSIGAGILQTLPTVWNPAHTYCIVQGDTTTAFFCALFAFHRGIKVVHIEAGLRTYDLQQPYPEEANRQMISRLASYHFTPHSECNDLLKQERVHGVVHTVGNTVLDLIQSYDLHPGLDKTVVITFHRRENWDKLDTFIQELKKLIRTKSDHTFIWCMHPNPVLQQTIRESCSGETNLRLIHPCAHKEFTSLLAKSSYIITDSGGLQEEASFLGKTCFVLRESTERYHIPEPYVILVKDIQQLSTIVNSCEITQQTPCTVYGNGSASKQIISILKSADK